MEAPDRRMTQDGAVTQMLQKGAKKREFCQVGAGTVITICRIPRGTSVS